jgi:hypothetical protein
MSLAKPNDASFGSGPTQCTVSLSTLALDVLLDLVRRRDDVHRSTPAATIDLWMISDNEITESPWLKALNEVLDSDGVAQTHPVEHVDFKAHIA